jgi:hypothetical protein
MRTAVKSGSELQSCECLKPPPFPFEAGDSPFASSKIEQRSKPNTR